MSSPICQLVEQKQLRQRFNIPPTRLDLITPYTAGVTKRQLDMRRKCEILKYQTKNGKITQNMQFASIVNAQSSTNMMRANRPECLKIPTKTNAANIPGPTEILIYDDSIPLYNFASRPLPVATEPTIDPIAFRFFGVDTVVLDFSVNTYIVGSNTITLAMLLPVTCGFLQIYNPIITSASSFQLDAVFDVISNLNSLGGSITGPGVDVLFSSTPLTNLNIYSSVAYVPTPSTSPKFTISTTISQLPTIAGNVYELQFFITGLICTRSNSVLGLDSILRMSLNPSNITIKLI